MKQPLRVLVVDDSRLFIRALSGALERDGDIEVVGTAANGREAVDAVASLLPDLVTMDIHMPVMDGLEAVEQIMASRPTPILLLTGDPSRHGEEANFDALSRGALDLMPKPVLVEGGEEEQARLREEVRLLATVPVVFRRRRRRRLSADVGLAPAPTGGGGVGIVASTGGPPIVADILAALPPDFPLPVIVVQHLAGGFAPHLVSWLGGSSRLPVRLAKHGEALARGTVYVAPDAAQMTLEEGDRVCIDPASPPEDGHRPSGTRLLASMALVWGARSVGVILSGMGGDGGRGLLEIRRAGGTTIAQDEASSAVFGMPRVARDLGAVERVLASSEVAEALVQAALSIQASRRSPG